MQFALCLIGSQRKYLNKLINLLFCNIMNCFFFFKFKYKEDYWEEGKKVLSDP